MRQLGSSPVLVERSDDMAVNQLHRAIIAKHQRNVVANGDSRHGHYAPRWPPAVGICAATIVSCCFIAEVFISHVEQRDLRILPSILVACPPSPQPLGPQFWRKLEGLGVIRCLDVEHGLLCTSALDVQPRARVNVSRLDQIFSSRQADYAGDRLSIAILRLHLHIRHTFQRPIQGSDGICRTRARHVVNPWSEGSPAPAQIDWLTVHDNHHAALVRPVHRENCLWDHPDLRSTKIHHVVQYLQMVFAARCRSSIGNPCRHILAGFQLYQLHVLTPLVPATITDGIHVNLQGGTSQAHARLHASLQCHQVLTRQAFSATQLLTIVATFDRHSWRRIHCHSGGIAGHDLINLFLPLRPCIERIFFLLKPVFCRALVCHDERTMTASV
mmetsp:Transcript_25645/g.47312  ORF Transcript_25645/g.47312 Transcript_25645/m.47312 type:complete len:386 (-) Transcript_25645:150-1307(-)